VDAEVLEPVLGFRDGRLVPGGDPPQGGVQVDPLKLLAAPTHDGEMLGIAVDELTRRRERLPGRQVDDQPRVLTKAAHGRGVTIRSLHPPDKAGRRLGARVDRRERRHELSQ